MAVAMKSVALALLLLCAPVFGQTDAIAVTVSQTVALSPDEITFTLGVLTDLDVSLDQVLQAVQPLGLAASDLLSLNTQQYGPNPSQTQRVYVFGFTTAYSKFTEANGKISALRRTLSTNTPAMDLQLYSLSIAPSSASREQARQAALSQLFADAKQRASSLAAAAGVSLGAIVGVSDGESSPTVPLYGPYGPVAPGPLRTTFSISVRYAVK
jgi:hypothetical protein